MPAKRCPRCFGLLQIDCDESSAEFLRCLNCGHREYSAKQAERLPSRPAGRTTQKEKPASRTQFPVIDSEVTKRGKVNTTADFFLDGRRHKIELSVARKSLIALGGLDRTRLECMLSNIFFYPLAHRIVRDESLYGRHADPNRREFMSTAREIDGMLSAWLKVTPASDRVFKQAVKELKNGNGHPGSLSDRIIVFLIERNWLNIKSRTFPDNKKPTKITQFLRSLRARSVGTMANRYARSSGYKGSGIDDAVFPVGRNQIPIERRGCLLASGILAGGWYLRQITEVDLTPPF